MGKNKELISRFKDMANCANASYAFLEYVYENIESKESV
ncbi:diadenosine tetraphosphate hydrolase [Helicobacter trogontum]|uniref:Diadenosine tetraphosphate hydrolase n=1 Tax=Helicobacter trogontum TaxID=50960 RepID=A0A4U8S1V8_9HELI|nr:diadenosine tetraphosphate hydrolase [Helicobacter trogontum]